MTAPRSFDPAPVLAMFHNRPDLYIARRLGVRCATVHYWRKGRRLSEPLADRVAAAMGLHPMNLWGDDWLTGIGSNGEGPAE